MANSSIRQYAVLFPVGDALADIEDMRARLDPKSASRCKAHITLIYPQELQAGQDAFIGRAQAIEGNHPFTLKLGRLRRFPPPYAQGVYIEISDEQSKLQGLRNSLIPAEAPPMLFDPHLTVIHPSNAIVGDNWPARHADCFNGLAVHVNAVDIIADQGGAWATSRRMQLQGGTGGTDLVGAVIVDRNRILLGRRASYKKSWPGMWDIIGGHVEPAETAERAITKEVSEELGITLEKSIATRTIFATEATRITLFLITGWNGVPHLNNDEHSQIAWFSLPEAQRLLEKMDSGYAQAIIESAGLAVR